MKNNSNRYLGYLIICSLIVVPSLVIPIFQTSLIYTKEDNSHVKTSANGVSKYSVGHNVTYEVIINYTLESNNNRNYWLKWSRIDTRYINNSYSPYCPPYQKSKLLYNSITSEDPDLDIDWNHIDKFNNTFDNISLSLTTGQKVYVNQKYIVNLNEISFSGITDPDIGAYNPSDEIHSLYNVTEQYYECNDTELIALSNYLVDPGDNEIEKAQKIINWISSEIDYEVQTVEMGADWANTTGKGDCSEYSDLMITLLRIQGIPARKMQGDVITNNPAAQPVVGTTWTYTSSGDEIASTSSFLGHAWVEYYVPNIGWIACDPTWHGSYNYFNRIDNFHLVYNNGAWFDMPQGLTANELGPPGLVYQSGADFEFIYDMTITVIASDFIPFDWTFIITIAILVGVVALVALIIYVIIKKTR
jgi:transglutaminase-like putative cysteine protease